MAGLLPHPRPAPRRTSWPRELHRAALFLGIGGATYWSSFALAQRSLWIPGVGLVYVDLLLAWVAVLLHVAAWPYLWGGLRDLRARRPKDTNPVLAWRAFLFTVALTFAPLVVLPLQYRAFASSQVWLVVLYVTAFPFVPWTFIPVLALHGILFGRVANYLDPKSRHLADLGACLLFAVAGVTTAILVQYPSPLEFTRSWTVGRGLLPAAAFAAYAIIAFAMTLHVVPTGPRAQTKAVEGTR